jgi:hypothetical protein
MNGIHQFLVYGDDVKLIKHIHTSHKEKQRNSVTHYTKAMERSALNHPSPRLPQAFILPPPAYFPHSPPVI